MTKLEVSKYNYKCTETLKNREIERKRPRI